jgi:hypothetical protein
MKNTQFLLIFILFFNCKSKPIETIKNENIGIESKTSVLNKINLKKIDFNTIFIKSSVKFEDENLSQRVNVDIKIKKDEIIWVNVKLLGIPLAKAFITPEKVHFFEKINNTYFDGDFSVISNLLGTELNFDKIQNMILGQPLEKLNEKEYSFLMEDQLYIFNSSENNFEKTLSFKMNNYNLIKQNIIQNVKNIGIKIDYETYQNIQNIDLPQVIKIIALRNNGNANFDINYNSIILNEDLTFPYNVPSNYKLRNF